MTISLNIDLFSFKIKNYQIESITGGEFLCQLLACHNVEQVCTYAPLYTLWTVFELKGSTNQLELLVGYPGGAALSLVDGIYKTERFEFILSHHEQGAGHMTEGYACASK